MDNCKDILASGVFNESFKNSETEFYNYVEKIMKFNKTQSADQTKSVLSNGGIKFPFDGIPIEAFGSEDIRTGKSSLASEEFLNYFQKNEEFRQKLYERNRIASDGIINAWQNCIEKQTNKRGLTAWLEYKLDDSNDDDDTVELHIKCIKRNLDYDDDLKLDKDKMEIILQKEFELTRGIDNFYLNDWPEPNILSLKRKKSKRAQQLTIEIITAEPFTRKYKAECFFQGFKIEKPFTNWDFKEKLYRITNDKKLIIGLHDVAIADPISLSSASFKINNSLQPAIELNKIKDNSNSEIPYESIEIIEIEKTKTIKLKITPNISEVSRYHSLGEGREEVYNNVKIKVGKVGDNKAEITVNDKFLGEMEPGDLSGNEKFFLSMIEGGRVFFATF